MSEKRVPELRFKGFDDAWEQRKLGEIFNKISRKVEVQENSLYKQIGSVTWEGNFLQESC